MGYGNDVGRYFDLYRFNLLILNILLTPLSGEGRLKKR
jgi:hypothetical protein